MMSDLPVVFLQSPQVVLRPLEEPELPQARRWINDPEVRKFLLVNRPLDLVAERAWHAALDRSPTPQDVHLAIEARLPEGPRLAGACGLHFIDWIHRHAEVGIVLGEKDLWGRGFGTAAVDLLTAYAFDTLGMHRVEARVFAFNPRSAALFRKLGYREEARLKDRAFREGRWHDEVVLAVLEREWRERAAARGA